MVTKENDKENAPAVGDKPPQMDNSASFLRAARAGNLEKVLEYLKGSIDINTSNANGLNALHLASKEGHVPVVKELLHRGAEVNAATKKGNTALHIASLAGQTDVVRLLVEKGANVNAQSQNGFTPLYMAAQENHDAVVRLLLANNASQSLATEDGFTPLAVALQQGHDKVVAVLLENDAKGKVRLPALHIAAKKDDTKAAALLLQTHEHNPDVTSKSGFTPLHIAAHYGNANIAALLLEKGADVNFPAKHQITPLHVAAKWGKANMVKLLLEEGAKLDASTRDGLTPLHCAARSGHDQVVDQLIEKGAPITAKTKNGLAPLHMASQGDHVESAKILLNHKAPVDEITVDYLTALHVAAHCGHVGVAKLLLEKKADANSRALNGFTPLHIACKKNRIKVVELLLRHGASIEATTESGLTPLHVASFMGCMNIVIYLIQHGANADVPTVRGETPLHLAARANQTDIVRILLRNGAQVDTKAREQQTPLHIAARLGNTDIVGLLLQHGAHVDSATKDQYTALHIAAKEGQEDVVNMLLDHGASVTAKTKKGFTPLHLAAKYGNLRVAKLLLQKEADVDAQGKNGVTPLHVAAHYDHNDVALLLLEQGASPHAAAKNGYTSLHIAAKKNQMDIGSTLLEYGAKTNAESKAGFSALHLAVQEGHAEMAALLIEHGANVDAAAKNGLTPLHLCAQEDKVNVAAILAKHNARIDPATAAGYTPLHVACHFGQTNMIRFLLQHGADVNATTTHGYTPLHQAAQQGHTMIINLLLENRAQPNATTNQGQTALSIAQKLGYISVIETLKVVTETTVTTTTTVVTEEKYKVVAPETMHETFMSDSEDEGEQDNMMGDHSFKYLTADEMKSLGDDSLPIDVTRDERLHEAHVAHIASQQAATRPHGHIAPSAQEEDRLSPSHLDQSFAKAAPDNVEVKRTPVHAGFLVSFMVDARGGAMRGCRHSGVRVIIPPRRASMPMRVTCRFIRKEKLAHPPPLMEGEACAARIIEMGPAGAKFLGPVVIEVPHFASLRGKEREIVILRSDNGEAWKEHTMEATEDAVSEVLNGSFDAQELNAMQDFNTNRVTRILTTDFPQYFAVVCRNRQEVHSIGPEGGMVSSTVVSQVQAIFPDGALTKKIKVGLQVNKKKKHKFTFDHNKESHLADTETLSDDLSVAPKKQKFGRYFSCFHTASPVKSFGEKRPSDSTTVDIHEGLVAPRKRFFIKAKTAMRVAAADSTNNNNMKPVKKSSLKASFPFGLGNKKKEVKAPCDQPAAATVERAAKENNDKNKHDKDDKGKQGSSIQSVPETELPVDNVSDVATVVCESPVKSHTLSCSTPRPIGDSVVEELAISLMTFLNEDKLLEEVEGSSTQQRKALTPELTPSRSPLVSLTPSKKRHGDQPLDMDDVPSSPKKQRLFRSRVLHRKKSKEKNKPKHTVATPERSLAVVECEKAEMKSVRSETNLEVSNIIKNTQSMESIDLNSETQSRKDSALEVTKVDDADDVQNVSQKKGFLMRFGRHRVSSVVKVATDEPSSSTVQADDGAAQPSSEERPGKASIIKRLRKGKPSSDMESTQNATSPNATVPSKHGEEKPKKSQRKRSIRPSEKVKVFKFFEKRSEPDDNVAIIEGPRESEIEASVGMRVCESQLEDEKAVNAKSEKKDKYSNKDDLKSNKKDEEGKCESFLQENKTTKKRKKKVLFSRFTVQKPERRNRHSVATINKETTDGETSTTEENQNKESEKELSTLDEKIDEAKSEADTTVNQDSGQRTSEPITSERRDSEQSSRGFFSWFTGWRSVDDKIKEVPESCCDTTAEKSEAAKDLDPNTEADVSDIQSESESVTDECAGEKRIDLEEQMQPKAEQKDKLETSKNDADKPTEVLSTKTKSLLKRFRRKRSKKFTDLIDSGRGESSEGSRPSSGKTMSRPSSASKLFLIFRQSKLVEKTTTEEAKKADEIVGTTTSDKTKVVASEMDDSAVASDPLKDEVLLSEQTSFAKDKQKDQPAENLEEPLSISEKDSGYEPGRTDKKALSTALYSGRRKPRRNRNRKDKGLDNSAKADVPLTEVAEEKVIPRDIEIRRVAVQMSSPQQVIEQKPKTIETKVAEVKDTKVIEVVIRVNDQKAEGKLPSPAGAEGKRSRRRRRGKKKSPTKPTEGEDTESQYSGKGRKQRLPDADTAEKAAKDDLDEIKPDVKYITADTIKSERSEDSSVDDEVPSAETAIQDKAKDFEAEKKSVTMLVVKEKQSLLKFWHTKKSTASSKAQAVPAEMGKPISTKTDDITEDFDFETRVRSNKKKAFLDRFQKSKAVEPYIASDNGGEDQANADTTRYAESPHMETSKSHQSNKGSASSRKGSQAEGKPQKGLLSSFLQWSLGRIESPEKTEVRVTRWHSELVLASTKEDDKDAQEPKIEIVIHDIDKKQGDFRGRVQSTESETQRSDTTSKFETPVEEFKPLVREQRKATGFFSNFGWPASLWTFGTGTEDGGQQDNAEDGGKTDTSNETQGRENVSTEAELAEKATKEAETKPTKSNATVMDGVQDSEKAEEDVKTTESQEANDKEVILKDVRKKEKSPIKDKTERKAKNEKLVLNVNDGAEKVDERAERSPDDISAKTVDKQRSFLKFPTIKLAKMSKSVKNLLNTEAKTASKFEKEEAQFESEESQVDSKPEDEDTTERTDKYYQGEKTKAEVKVEPKKARCSFLKNISVPKLPKSKKDATEQSSIVKPVKTKKEDKERKEQNKPSILEDSYKEDQLETDTEDERLAVKPKPLGKVAIGAASASEPLVARASEEEKSTSESAESPKRTITITIPLPKFRMGRKNKGKRTSAKKHKAKRTDKKKLSCYKVAGKKSVVTENVTDQDASDTVVENADDALRCETTKVTDVLEKKAYRVSSFLNPIFRSNKKTEPQVKVDIRNNKGLNAENKTIEEITDEKAETAANSLEETPSPIDKAKNTEKGKQPQDEKPSKSKRNRRGKKSNPFSKEKSTEHVKTEAGETKVKGELDGTIVDKKTVHQAEEGPKQKSEHPSTIVDQPAFSESPKLSGKRAQETQQFFAVKLKFNKAKRLTESTPIGDDKKITETSDNEQKQVDKKNRDLAENAMQADEKKAETGQYDDELLTDRPTETPEPIEERQAKMRRTFTINFAKFLAKDRNVSIEEARKEAEKNGNVHEADDDKSSLGGPKKDTEEFKDELNADHRKEREPKKEQSAVREKQDTGKCYEFQIPNFSTTATTLKKSFNKEEYPKIEKEPKAKGHSDKNKVCNKAEIISKMDVQLEGEPTESVKEKSYTEKIATDKKEQFVQCAAAQRDTKKLKFTINFHKPTFVRKRETKRANKEVLESPVHAEKAGIEDSDEKNAEETEQDSKMSGPEDETSTEKVEVADGQIYSKTTGETELIAVEEQGKAAPKTPKKSSLAVPRLSWPKFFSLKKHDKSGSQETVDKARKFSVEEANDLQDTVPTEGLGEIGLEEAEIDGMKTTESHDIAHLGTPSEVTPKKNDEGRKQVTFTITIPKLSIPKFKPKMNVRDISDETATKSDIEQTQKDDDTVKIYESATDLAKLDTNKTGETEDETVSVEKKPMDSAKKGNAADATKTSKRSWWHSLVSRDDTTPTKVSDKNVRQEPSVTQEKFFRFSKKPALNVEKSTDTLEKPILEPVPELSENEASKSEDVSKDELADEQPADEIGPITKEQTYEAVVKQDNQEIPELKNTAKERKFYAVFKLGRKVDSSEVKVKDAKTEVEDQQAETKPTKSEVTVEGINEPISKKPKKFRFKKMLWKMVTVKASEKADQTNRAKIGAGSIESDLQEKSKKKVPKKNVAKTLNMDGTKPDISPEFFKKEVKKSLLPGQKESPVLITKQDITIDAETGSVKIEEVDDAKSSPNEEKRDAGCSRSRRKRRNRNRKNRLNIMRSCDTEIEKTIKERKSTKDENDKAAFVENKKIDVEENSFECSLVEEGAREVVIESNTGEVTKVEAVSKKCVVTKNATSSTVVTTSSIATFCESQPVGATANAAADDTAIESITEEKAEHKKLDKSVVEESFKIRDNVTEVERKDGTTVLTVKFEVEKEKQRLGEKRQSFPFLGRFSQKHRVDSRLEPISDDSPDVHITSEGDVTPIDVSYSVDGVTEENTVNAGVSDDKKPRKRYFKPAKHRITKNAVDTVQLPDNSPKATHTSGSNDENAQNSDVVKTKEIVKSAGSVQKANKQDAADIADNTFIASKNTKDAEGKPKNERAQLYVAKAEKGGVVGFLTKRFRRPQTDMSKNSIIGETTVNDAPKQVQNVEKGLEKKTDNMETSEEDDEDEEESTVESTKNESGSSDSTEIKDTSDEDSAEKKEEDKADVTQDTKKTDGGNEKTARKSKGVFGWLKRSRPSSGCESEKNKDFDGEKKKFDPAKIEIGGSKDKDLAADKALEAPNVSVNGGDSSKVVDTGSVKEERSKKKTKRFFQKNSKIEVEKLAIVGKKGFGDLEQDQSAGASTSSQAPKYDHFGRSYTFHWPGVRYTTTLEPVAQQ